MCAAQLPLVSPHLLLTHGLMAQGCALMYFLYFETHLDCILPENHDHPEQANVRGFVESDKLVSFNLTDKLVENVGDENAWFCFGHTWID